ncbi:hypothetical protein WP50_20380 [Lactiplantibacillus plantarum]|nr:hypothetical protein WP50_20380 [Lactiplantibacillus plantarum]
MQWSVALRVAATHLTIFNLIDHVTVINQPLVMGHHYDGLLVLMSFVGEALDDVDGAGRVQASGRFICKNDAWIIVKSAGDGNTLAFTTGEVTWVGIRSTN